MLDSEDWSMITLWTVVTIIPIALIIWLVVHESEKKHDFCVRSGYETSALIEDFYYCVGNNLPTRAVLHRTDGKGYILE